MARHRYLLKPYTSREMTLSLERRLASRFSIAARYTRKDLLRAVEYIGVLDSNDNEVYIVGNPGFWSYTRHVFGVWWPDAKWP